MSTEQKVPAGTVEVQKKAEDLKLGLTTIILSADSEEKLKYYIDNVSKIPTDFNCEIICVSSVDCEDLDAFDVEHFLYISKDINKAGLQNIGRQLAAKYSKYLLFLDDFNDVSKEWLEDRVKGFEYNPIIGIIGRGMPKVTDEIKQSLFDGLQGLIRLSDQDFAERCCDKAGGFKNVCRQTMATPTELFDRVGGFDIKSEHPYLVYTARVTALGHGLVPQPN